MSLTADNFACRLEIDMGSKSFSAYAMCGLLCHDVTILYRYYSLKLSGRAYSSDFVHPVYALPATWLLQSEDRSGNLLSFSPK